MIPIIEKRIVQFTREKETKNAVRFKEVVSDKPPICNFLYLQKWYIQEVIDIVVTIETK